MKVKVINEKGSPEMCEIKVNNFLESIKQDFKVDKIIYSPIATMYTGWNCVMIIYSERE